MRTTELMCRGMLIPEPATQELLSKRLLGVSVPDVVIGPPRLVNA